MSKQKSRYLVLGLGVSGKAAARWLLRQNYTVYAFDDRPAQLDGDPAFKALLDLGLKSIEAESVDVASFDTVVVSPGISDSHFLCIQAKACGVPLIGEIELAVRNLRNICLGVTGTNGKTTVTQLVTHMLNTCGRKALAVGNCGVPLISMLTDSAAAQSVGVVELSSFQLSTVATPFLTSAALLNITPDHLDRHYSMDLYTQSKLSIFNLIAGSSPGYIHSSISLSPQENISPLLTFSQDGPADLLIERNALWYLGKKEACLPKFVQQKAPHDVENMLAAYALCRQFGIATDDLLNAVCSFQKPAHRIQFVRSFRGVSYIDDSKGTNIDAVIKAVSSLPGPIVLIAGGVDKGSSYLPWKKAFVGKVKSVVAIGQAAEKMALELAPEYEVVRSHTLEMAVKAAAEQTVKGDYVLLSPGCSSYDMFKDYVDRGMTFQRCVHAL